MPVSHFVRSLILVAAMAPAFAQAAETPVSMLPDARQAVPSGMIGVWKVDAESATAKSTQLRTFQYTADARLIVSFMTINQDGSQRFGHWIAALDGTSTAEYRSDNGATPVAELRVRKVDDHTLEYTNFVLGEIQARGQYKLSDDGTVLTLRRTPENGKLVTIVYHKWSGK